MPQTVTFACVAAKSHDLHAVAVHVSCGAHRAGRAAAALAGLGVDTTRLRLVEVPPTRGNARNQEGAHLPRWHEFRTHRTRM
jgi:hypothetical protein